MTPLAEAATTTLYITWDNGTNIPGTAGTTNLPSGNNSALGTANGKYITKMSTTAPTANNTRIQEGYNPGSTYYTLAQAYYTTSYATDAYISANATGKFYLRSSNIADKFIFQLRDYNPASGAAEGTLIAESPEYSGASTSSTAFNVAFNNATAYTLPAGHYLLVQVLFRPSANNREGFVYLCDNVNAAAPDGTISQSRINVEIKFKVDASAGVNGSISPTGTSYYDLGTTPSYAITANSGYHISSLTVDGVSVGAANGSTSYTYPFTAINRNHTINVNFVQTINTLTIQAGTGGMIQYPAGSMTWPSGTNTTYPMYGSGNFTFVVTPDTAGLYGIEEVYLNGVAQGVPQGQTAPYSFTTAIPPTTTISASFIRYYTVTATPGAGGTISPPGDSPVLSGQSLTYTIDPDNGYRILAVFDNGVNVGSDSSYTLTNVTSDHTITASFQQVHTIHATAGPNGIITPKIGDVLVDNGGSQIFNFTPDLGYRVNEVLVDGVSIGAVSMYMFSNVSAPHTIEVTFVSAPIPSTYCAVPPYVITPAPPNVMLMLSVEVPMAGPANPTVTCTGTPSAINYTCTSGGLGTYDNTRNYYGLFENYKCYTYSGTGATGLFTPSGPATNHQCGGSAWSGNMLNWATMLAVDAFRRAFTGGNRAVDTTTDTVLLGAQNNSDWTINPPALSNAELYMPVAGTNVTRKIVRQNAGIGFVLCPDGNTCNAGHSGSGEAQWPSSSTGGASVYSLRIKACSDTGGTESRCNSSTGKPEGTIQKYMEKMRFALMSYAADNAKERDGGILREKMKWVNPVIQNGLKYHNADGEVVDCSAAAGCENPEKEVNTNGTFVNNPDAASSGNSGLINYINKFSYTAGYKSVDPISELYYQVVRYFRNQTPSGNNYCNGLTEPNDNFPIYCNASKTDARGWRDPTLYSCSKNYVIAVNDANPHVDKRIPGTTFIADYGGQSSVGDWCGSSRGACDTDFVDFGVQVPVETWTNKVGDSEGITGATKATFGHYCEVDNSGVCISPVGNVAKLGRVLQSSKDNSYLIAGLAYYAHMSDLRSDLAGTQNLTTYMIDTQEPQGSMLVGPRNMLQLAAKYGGFDDLGGTQTVTVGTTNYRSPYKSATCGGVSASPNPLCSEWDADKDGYPDNYFFASEASKVESSLNKAFSSILNKATAGTAAAVANNRSGERGANIIQALFYPQWPNDMGIKWLGDVQALWFYLDPIGKFSGVFEDSDSNKELNLAIDLPPGSDATTLKALWKAGENLLSRAASDRGIYTLLSSTDITNSANAFTTTNRASLKPLMDLASVTDTVADEYINYVRGVDGGAKRSRTVTSNGVTGVWKLADVVNSKPQIQGAEPVSKWIDDYFDNTYRSFTKSTNYLANNYVYTGSNGGMLHAFKLGQVRRVTDSTNVYRIAEIIDDTDIGKELWAFLPTNVLPYLKNCADSNYCHQYMVDGTPKLLDASINNWCGATNYWTCERKTTYVTNTTTLNTAATSWKSVLVSSMGLGGATRDGDCNETLTPDGDPTNNADCIKTPVANGGFSSYFALDVTSPLSPQYMWEFSDASIENDSTLSAAEKLASKGLGLTTSGSTIIRINSLSGSPLAPDKTTNGRWFAVFGSGPSGTIDAATHQFLGRSDQNLKIYVVDLNASGNFVKCKTAGQSNCNYWVLDTGIKYAFAGPLTNSTIDIDKRSADSSSFYSDDIVYIPYTKATTAVPAVPALPALPPPSGLYPTAWDKGGIVRLLTNSDPDPMNWFVSTLIDDVGPITSSVDLLLNKTTKKLWVFFGEGRYFYTGDDKNSQRKIIGIADPCYNYDNEHVNKLSTTLATCPAVTLASLKDQTSTPLVSLGTSDKGWYINLAAASGTSGAERMKLSEVSASYNGVVFFPTFAPSTDPCVAGGDPSLWAVNYSTGGTPPSRAMQGKIVGTTSDQPVAKAQSLQSLFGNSSTSSGGRKADLGDYKGDYNMTPPILSPKPVKRIMSIQER